MKNEATRENKGFASWFTGILVDEKRSRFAVPLISIVLSLIVASVMLLAMGKNPITAFLGLLRGSGLLVKPRYGGGQNMLTDFVSFLSILTPMLLASLGVMVAMRTGLFNIGVAGQMLLGGFMATVLIGYQGWPAFIALPVIVLICIVSGALLGAFTGFLKYRFNIHEVVTAIMMNYIISYITGFFINTYFADPMTRQSVAIPKTAQLVIPDIPVGDVEITFPLGIILALLCAFGAKFLLDRTTTGYRLKAVGLNANCARYAGIRVGGNIVLAMVLSGALAGLAGATYYMGYFNTIVPKELAGLGYDAIAVSVLGNQNPIGTIFASFLITIFQKGSVYMSSTVGVPKEIASVVTGILLLFSACGVYIRYMATRWRDRQFIRGKLAGAQAAERGKGAGA